MATRTDIGSQVALAALLDTECLHFAMMDAEVVADAALWGTGDGATEMLASHPTIHHMVEAAVISPRPQVRATVAGRPDLDTELYPVLASDLHHTVRTRVASNPSAPGAVLERLCRDPHAAVRHAAEEELMRRGLRLMHTVHAMSSEPALHSLRSA